MRKAVESRRHFFKKVAFAAGFVAASSYVSKFMAAHAESTDEINSKSANDLARQKRAWLLKKFVPMTENDKQLMLDEILNAYNKDHT